MKLRHLTISVSCGMVLLAGGCLMPSTHNENGNRVGNKNSNASANANANTANSNQNAGAASENGNANRRGRRV